MITGRWMKESGHREKTGARRLALLKTLFTNGTPTTLMGPHDRPRWAEEGDTYEQRHSPLILRVCCKLSQQCSLSWWIKKLNPVSLPVPLHLTYKFNLFYCQCDSTSLLPLYPSSTAVAPQFGKMRPYTPSSYSLSVQRWPCAHCPY